MVVFLTAMLPEMLATWMICTGCAMRFFKETNRWRLAATFAVFAFSGVDFALCLYPPFQIPLLFLMIAILIGTCLELRSADAPCWSDARNIADQLGNRHRPPLAHSILDRRSLDALGLVAHTGYPGRDAVRRRSPVFKLFSGLAGFFQTGNNSQGLRQHLRGQQFLPGMAGWFSFPCSSRAGGKFRHSPLSLSLSVSSSLV